MTIMKSLAAFIAVTSVLALGGCNGGQANNGGVAEDGAVEMEGAPPALPPGGEHDHPSEGPHHGSLIELGNEQYHAELVHDDTTGAVTIYILDGAAAAQVPIEAAEVMINLKHDGKAVQHRLAAQRDEGDPEGRSSRFVSKEPTLGDQLDAEGADPRLVVKIDGKSYSGELAHDHDHDH